MIIMQIKDLNDKNLGAILITRAELEDALQYGGPAATLLWRLAGKYLNLDTPSSF